MTVANNTVRIRALLLSAFTLLCVVIAIWLFPRSQPAIALHQSLTREEAISRARAFAAAHQLPTDSMRVAVHFASDDETQTFIELEAGGKPAVNAEVNGRDVQLFSWMVRFFRPGSAREMMVTIAPDGAITGFSRTLADADPRPALDSVAAMRVADSIRSTWMGLGADIWQPVSSSVVTVQPSGRLDRTITYERRDRKLGAAPLRLDITLRGDLPGRARRYVKIPESFTRRYSERRTTNDLYAMIASLFVPLFLVFGFGALIRGSKRKAVRWRPAFAAGTVLGIVLGAAALNSIPGSWFGYNTAVTPGTFLAGQWMLAVGIVIITGLLSGVLLAMGELLTREAFPNQFDWWQIPRYAGTTPIAARILSGYTLAAFGLAYVSAFYLFTSRVLGWWSPSSLLDDPNLIASPFPWLSAIGNSLQAGVLEEVLFRAIPLALIARATRGRPWRNYALGAGVILTALVFGFAHANYPSWPAYARGVEIFLEAAIWALIYLRFGLITTIVAHFTFDLVLFGLFAAAGSALPYRISLVVVILAILTPALLVAVQRWRLRSASHDAPDSARFSAWVAPPVTGTGEYAATAPESISAYPHPVANAASTSLSWIAVVAAVVALVLALWPASKVATPAFSASVAEVNHVADSALRALGASPTEWTRFGEPSTDSWSESRRFFKQYKVSDSLITAITPRFLHPTVWSIRYVHPLGSVAERTEEWEIQLLGDGRMHGWHHVIPDSAPAPAITRERAEVIARASLAQVGIDTGTIKLLSANETKRPARVDVELEFEDTSIVLPAKASARVSANIAGDKVVGVSHRIFLPETWTRAEETRTTTHGLIGGAIVFVLFIGAIVGWTVFWRRPKVRAPLEWPTRWILFSCLGALCLIAMLLAGNGWFERMHGWETTQPFGRYQFISVLQLVFAGLMPLVFWGMWVAVDGARRRLDVPVHAARTRDLWLGASALVLASTAGRVVGILFPEQRTRDTVMGTIVPILDNVFEGVESAIAFVSIMVFAIIAIMAIRSRPLRLGVTALVLIAISIMSALFGADVDSEIVPRALAELVVNVVVVAVIWRFGRSSMATWLLAALIAQIYGGVANVLHGVTTVDRLSWLLSLIVTIAVASMVARKGVRAGATAVAS